ncbi:phosphonate metabolism protein PhnP [Marinobacterium jannaschii]|uniref:phosphonate metabolism protein PhnP n=1 Tax=Marinobacterium jannaschii TaxID=64970 RepID=UPI0004828DC4|nr:phosphonate metabolism protein PhnP [Marinobacterium jannaschii]
MKITLLGTGDVRQVPVYGCDCEACYRARIDVSYVRRPCSALLESAGGRLLLDGGLSDLCQRFKPGDLDAILLTHYHVDHVQGLFHLRWGLGPTIPVFGPEDQNGCADLLKHPGMLAFQPPLNAFESIYFGDLQLTPLPLQHSKPTFGYLLREGDHSIAYLTDTVGLPPETEAYLKQHTPDLLVVDCSHPPTEIPPRNHNDLNMALAIHHSLQPGKTVLTHISHELDAMFAQKLIELPAGVYLAEDQMGWSLDCGGLRRDWRMGALIG